MFRSRTVFVIGAGASCEIGMPLGDELARRIAKDLRRASCNTIGEPPPELDAAFQHIARDHVAFPRYREIMRGMADGLPAAPSIDNYLDMHKEDELIQALGKAAIAYHIMQSEHKSALQQRDSRFDIGSPKIEDSWYMSLMRVLTPGVSRDKIEEILFNTEFISFNYDRSLEQFLHAAIKRVSMRDSKAATQALKATRFIHPYGTIGGLPCLDNDGLVFEYGTEPTVRQILQASDNIRTFCESFEDQSKIRGQIEAALRAADKVVFLGFAYHDLNMELLALPERSNANHVYGTAMDFSEADREVATGQIRTVLRKGSSVNVKLLDCTCKQLFKSFSKSFPA